MNITAMSDDQLIEAYKAARQGGAATLRTRIALFHELDRRGLLARLNQENKR